MCLVTKALVFPALKQTTFESSKESDNAFSITFGSWHFGGSFRRVIDWLLAIGIGDCGGKRR